jgi:HPr kinase/phosphorylase
MHGSAVAVGERALLITGAAGTGKSTLALEMIALGAELIADDRVGMQPDDQGADGTRQLWLSAPPAIAGLVEVRGFGLVRLTARPRAALKLIADLDQNEPERLPLRRERVLSGVACPVMLCRGKPGLAATLTCLLRAEDWPEPEVFSK